MNKFELLVFDWDGTLMDSEARILDCFTAAMQDLNLPVPDKNEIRQIVGLALPEAVTALYPAIGKTIYPQFTERYRHHYLHASTVPSRLFEGAMELLQELRARNYLLAVATGKGRRGLDQSLVESGCKELFDATRCADESFSKPHPQMLLDIMDRLDANAENTLVIGDTEYDMLMAKSAKAQAVAVTYGVHDETQLLQHNPLACVDSISALRKWFDTLN
jgi:phosphoglycolate phosphatase